MEYRQGLSRFNKGIIITYTIMTLMLFYAVLGVIVGDNRVDDIKFTNEYGEER